MARQILIQAWDALRRNPARSALTMLGIVWGIASVTLLMAYGSSFRGVLMHSFEAFGRGAVIGWPGTTSEQAGGERCPGPAGAHQRLRAPVSDGARSLDNRGLRGGAHGEEGIGRLGDRYGGVDDLDPVGNRANLGCRAEQDHPYASAGRLRGTSGNFGGAQIRSARVNGDGDHGAGPIRRLTARRQRLPHARGSNRRRGIRGEGAAGCDTAGRRCMSRP